MTEAAVVDEVDAAVSGARKEAARCRYGARGARKRWRRTRNTSSRRRVVANALGRLFAWSKKYRVWDNLTPVRLRRLLEELGPMFVKMGQILANRSEILPLTLLR